jgi:cation diffusion facilitator family transporter
MSSQIATTPQVRIARYSVAAAAFLVVLKLVSGLITGSLGLIAEAAHSGTDFAAATLTLLALRVAVRPPDREHPYGHGKAEHLAALAESAVLIVVSLVVAGLAIARLTGSAENEVDATWWAFVVVAIVLAVDLSRTVVSGRAAREYQSAALASNALHFASDFAGTLAVLAGLILASAGFPEGDAIAGLIVAALVVFAAQRLMRENVQVLMDREPEGAEEAVREAIAAAEPRAELRRVRTREAGGRAFVDVVVAIAPDAALQQGHTVADNVERAIGAALPDSDVTVHMEPLGGGDLRERATGAALSVRNVREIHNVRSVTLDGARILSLHVKLPADETLERAHAVCDQVEDAILGAVPEVDRVHVHLEPLAAPVEATTVSSAEHAEHRAALERIVWEMTGKPPLALRLHREPRGVVAFVTLALPGDRTLGQAHEAAAEVEARAEAELPDLVAVVVHTEPA